MQKSFLVIITGNASYVINDADAAGYAVMNYGSGKGKKG